MPGRNLTICDKCGNEQPTWAVTKCHICGQHACHKCATFAYGRYFCSSRCAMFFFHAEGEEDEQPDHT